MSTWPTLAQLAEKFDLDYERLEKRLRRWRPKNLGEWKGPEPEAGNPVYTYNPVKVIPLCKSLQKVQAGELHPRHAYFEELKECAKETMRKFAEGEWWLHPRKACEELGWVRGQLSFLLKGEIGYLSHLPLATKTFSMRNGRDCKYLRENDVLAVKNAIKAVPSPGANENEMTLEQVSKFLRISENWATRIVPKNGTKRVMGSDGRPVIIPVFDRKIVESFRDEGKHKIPSNRFSEKKAYRLLHCDREKLLKWWRGIQPELGRPLDILEVPPPYRGSKLSRLCPLKSDVLEILKKRRPRLIEVDAEGEWWAECEVLNRSNLTLCALKNAAEAGQIVSDHRPGPGRSYSNHNVIFYLRSSLEENFPNWLPALTPATTPPNATPEAVPSDQEESPKRKRGRPRGSVDADVQRRKREMLEAWERKDYGTNKALYARHFGFHRQDASDIINSFEAKK